MAKGTNLPRYKQGWITKGGKQKLGFWQFRHQGKYITLTKWGAPQGDGGKQALNQAIEARNRFLSERRAPVPTESPALSVRDVLTPYLTKHVPTVKPNSQVRLRRTINQFLDGVPCEYRGIKAYRGFGNLAFDDLTDKHFDEWEAAHPNWSAGGRRTEYHCLRAAFEFAKKRKGGRLIDRNPLDGVETQQPKPRTATFADDEAKTFIESASPQFADLFTCCLDLACRPMEAGTVTTDHVKRNKHGLCWVLEPEEWKNGGKTGKRRVIPLSPKWEAYSKRKLIEADKIGQPVLMFATKSDVAWNANKIASAFNYVVEKIRKAGKQWRDELVFYSTRHTAITRFLRQGKNASHVAAACGTSEEMIRKHYNHLIDDYEVLLGVVSDVA